MLVLDLPVSGQHRGQVSLVLTWRAPPAPADSPAYLVVTHAGGARVCGTAIGRVIQGVYRMAGAPVADHEAIYATWLALGDATAPRTEVGVAPVVAAGTTAAVVHGFGDYVLDRLDFVVPAR